MMGAVMPWVAGFEDAAREVEKVFAQTRLMLEEQRSKVLAWAIRAQTSVWCEGCQGWYPLDSVHGTQHPRRGSVRYPRRVRWAP